jgi:hypothetical protein
MRSPSPPPLCRLRCADANGPGTQLATRHIGTVATLRCVWGRMAEVVSNQPPNLKRVFPISVCILAPERNKDEILGRVSAILSPCFFKINAKEKSVSTIPYFSPPSYTILSHTRRSLHAQSECAEQRALNRGRIAVGDDSFDLPRDGGQLQVRHFSKTGEVVRKWKVKGVSGFLKEKNGSFLCKNKFK